MGKNGWRRGEGRKDMRKREINSQMKEIKEHGRG